MKIKNWKKLQHFKERTPPWVKLYRDILDQRDINVISDCSFRVLIGLWLLAAEDKDLEGNLPEIPDIAFRLRKSEDQITKCLQELSAFLIYDDTTVISSQYQDDAPETETEAETYSKETETKDCPLNIELFLNDKLRTEIKRNDCPRLDFHVIIQSYHKFMIGKPMPDNPIGSFRGFAKKHYKDYIEAHGVP